MVFAEDNQPSKRLIIKVQKFEYFFVYSLEKLRDELIQNKFTGIKFLIINSFEEGSKDRLDRFHNVTSISVEQDTTEDRVWELYEAESDDIVILDKCLRVVFHLSLPDSVVTDGIVKKSIIKAYAQNQCTQSCVNFVKQKSSKLFLAVFRIYLT